jgi:hypothetical protein
VAIQSIELPQTLLRLLYFHFLILRIIFMCTLCSKFRIVLGCIILGSVLHGCFLFPVDPVEIEFFSPSLAWLRPTRGVVMDVNPRTGTIISIGDTTIQFQRRDINTIYDAQGALLSNEIDGSESGYIGEVLADYDGLNYTTVSDGYGQNAASVLYTPHSAMVTNRYTRYNTQTGSANTGSSSPAGSIIYPSIARGPGQNQRRYSTSSWMIGTFTDSFRPDIIDGRVTMIYTCPSFGKADCFVTRMDGDAPFYIPVRHQWGGTENDLAYDVASDTAGNATIFLRAGSDFAITSATQTLVRVKTGYNIVRLDTNGLLTQTFPVRLDAQGEISDTKIALAPNKTIYILAKDEQRKQYFLANVSATATSWIHYFPTTVSTKITYFYGYYSRMDVVADSKSNAYITGSFYDATDFGSGKVLPDPNGTTAFVAKYSPANVCIGATALGSGTGITIRLSPQEDALYVNGWGGGPIMGVDIPDPNAGLPTRLREFRSPAFLVKLKL